MTAKFNTIALMQSLGGYSHEISTSELEILFGACVQHSKEFCIWRGTDNKIKFISHSCLQLTGHSADDYINNSELLTQKIHPDDVTTWENSVNEKSDNHSQIRIVKSAGKTVWFEHGCKPMFDKAGEAIGHSETFIEINEQKTTETTNQKLAMAFEQYHHGIIITNHLGVIEYLNPAYNRNRTSDSPLQRGDILPLLSNESDQINEILATVQNAKLWQKDCPEAQGKWYRIRISPIFDNNELTHLLVVKIDISQRILDTQRLVEQHEELQALFNLVEIGKKEWEWSLDCIHDVVILANDDGIVQRANRSVQKMLNIETSAFIGQDWKMVLPTEIMNQTKLPTEGEFFEPTQKKWLTYHIFTISDQLVGTNIKQVITIHDETTIKMMNQDLTAAYDHLKSTQSQMVHQEKMASIGQLAAGVAHEINNPTGFISSNLVSLKKYTSRLIDHINFLEQSLEPLSDPEMKLRLKEQQKKIKLSFIQEDIDDLVDESLEGAERIKVIVQNLKSFSRVDDTATAIVDLHECLNSALSIGWNEIKYIASVEKDYQPIPKIYCSAQQLNQVFLNLMVNAAQSMKEQGVITISTSEQAEWIVIKISDTGSGIPEKSLSKIFEPFYTTKEVGKGTGLGLSICYDIIQNHNGEISVESKMDVGTTFTIKLPIICEQPEKNEDND